MALTTEALERIRSQLGTAATAAEQVSALRRAFPGLSVTRCDAGDIDTETPVLETTRFNLYLLDAADHCARVTADLSRATGLILAEKPKGAAP
ncbi:MULTISPECIES: hypothetical protein [Methylococcus]|jgi:hypothetical protein|uniref:Uncharacterized protein n=2 Tax=Methylococcus capsulatus TaxID=414 RepID=Q60C95_METCA|nr:hypothetical protein [Methylococcus capsulatus]AAU90654.1 conserved hypothetical protein [Methylococcus capsulatus str. Bath]QXP86299.1 hypothetical protein KW112_07605 [Methylococcus capsulatus]QXP89678.1 hypothetical protein KW114_11285 [Methylococcus capsulatus]QXP94030.1 hypothetical protein KW113_02035 [Methylococcus capsulatus]UQN11235.1 hypothetical protein M3M30_09345 [Methylococcus capsulatus]